MSRAALTGRRIAGAGIALGLAAATALLAPMTASAAPAAPAGPGAVGPGVQVATPVGDNGAEFCTANFLYSGGGSEGHSEQHGDGWGEHQSKATGGDLYLGVAAHCNAAADAMSSVDGCTEPVMPEGTEVAIRGRDGKTYSGTVAYNSWVTMQAKGEKDPALCNLNDLELIKLDPEAAAVADPTVPNFGGPTALDTDGTQNGEKVYSYQPNQLVATPNKQGISLGQPDPRTHVVATVPPGVPGDSGSGYLDADGKAFGLLSSLMTPTTTNGVTDIAKALEYAAENGSVGKVSLVTSDVPFAPAGPLTEMPTAPQLPDLPLSSLKPAPLV